MEFKKIIKERFIKELSNLQYSNSFININKFDVIDDLELQLEIEKQTKEIEKLIQKIVKSIDK